MLGRPMNDPNPHAGGAGSWNSRDLVGQILADRYRIEKLLGEGGMGSVYRAVHVALRKKVAVKVLHQDLCRDATQVDRFLQEARAASMIGHENIVDIVDFGPVPNGSVFFVMEFLEGEDLAELLRRESRLPWARARGLMLQIVRALGAAHSKGIIHRDLKPANCFLVRRSDGRDFVKLLDFGIAKVTDPESGDSGGLTRTGAVFGTAKYMAPEQACGEPADQRTDIYAAAICLYEFLTGTVPYDGDNFMRVLSRHLTEPLTLPSTMAPDANISPAVEAIIVKALSKRPDDRYATMEEFEAALLSVGPDGNLAGVPYEGPPQIGPAGIPAGGTLWLNPQRPASRPPEIRGTVLLNELPTPEYVEDYGSGRAMHAGSGPHAAAPHGWAGGPGPLHPASRPPSSPPQRPPGLPPTNPPDPYTRPPTYSPGGDYTIFAPERRSPVKLVLMLAIGGLVAIGGGGLAAWLVLRDDVPEGPTVTHADPKPKAEVSHSPSIQQPVDLVIPETETPQPPDPADPPDPPTQPPPDTTATAPKDPVPETTPDDPPPQTKTRSGKGRTGSTRSSSSSTRALPTVSAEPLTKLGDREVAKGFGKASRAAKACPGGLPGMSIRVRATINQKGRVLDAKPMNNTSLPVARCVAQAVEEHATFEETTKALDSKEWTYSF